MKKFLILLVVLASFGNTSKACSPFSVPTLDFFDLTGDILTLDYTSNTAWGCDYNIVLEIACMDGTIITTELSPCVSKPDASPMAYPSPTYSYDLGPLLLCSDETYQFRAKEANCGTSVGGSAYTGYTTFVYDLGGGPGGPMTLTMDNDSITICLGSSADLGCEVTNNCTPVTYTWNPGALPGEDVTVSPPLGETTYTLTVAETGVCGITLTGTIVVTVNDIPVAGTLNAVPDEVCEGDNSIITLTGSTGNIQWQSGPASTGPWTDISGETGTTLDTGPLFTTTWFQAEVSNSCGTETVNVEIIVHPIPNADFEFEINGVSSSTGLTGGCFVNLVNFLDGSSVGAPGVITNWAWNFGDANSSTATNPDHTYASAGTYTVTLTVTTDGGCVSVFTMVIVMTDTPDITIVQNNPTCYGFSDGSFTVLVSGGSGGAGTVFQIWDESLTIINVGGSNAVNSLQEGTYTWDVDDNGCTANGTVVLTDPPEMIIDLYIFDVPCNGDATGYAIVDTVDFQQGAWSNTVFIWSTGQGGLGVDSIGNLVAGTYTIDVNDEFGCAQSMDFVVTEPPILVFSEIGYEPAYCRLYNYQKGNGQVYAAATGGTPDYTYLWTLLGSAPLQTSINTTWGGLNPGDYEMVVTDGNGCILTQIVSLDSVNPTAILDITSQNFVPSGSNQGTAPVCIEVQNNSEWFANPLNPIADTSFWLSMDYPTVPWQLYKDDDFFLTFDTCYNEGGQYDVCLKIQNKNGCEDSICHLITVFTPFVITPPNVFTPNGDGINDVFTFEFLLEGATELHVTIVNRWGVKMAEITEVDGVWDGTDRSGSDCKNGVYFYVWEATAENGDLHQGQGNIQLIGKKPK